MKPVIPEFNGEYSFLSNFYPANIKFRVAGHNENAVALDFPSSEHAFQAAKSRYMVDKSKNARVDYILSVRNAPDPSYSKSLGRRVKIDTKAWDENKDWVMREVVLEKFLQHTDLADQLLATGAAMLVEGNTWGDTYWGRCEGKGYNHLGVILMETRGYLENRKREEILRQKWMRPPIDCIIAG